MQRLDLRVLGAVQIVQIVALDGLMEKGQAEREHDRDDRENLFHHSTGTPGSSVQTSVPGWSRIRSASWSGRPISGGKVPKCRGITRFTFSMRQASAASRGPMV